MSKRISRWAASLALVACSGLAMAEPAQARHGWGGGWGRHYHRHNRVDAGDVLAGVAVIGVIAAIASASSQSNRRSRDRDADDYRYRGQQNDGYRDWRGSDAPRSDDRASSRSANDEMTAVDGCVVAAESQGGTGARVDTIRAVERDGSGYRVSGSVMRDARDEGNYARRDSFDCAWANGQVSTVNISGR